MFVQINGQDYQLDKPALRVLRKLKAWVPTPTPQDHKPARDLVYALADLARRRLDQYHLPCDLGDDYDDQAPLRVFITTDEPDPKDRTALFRRSICGPALEALRKIPCSRPSSAEHPQEAIEAVETLLTRLGFRLRD